MQVKHYRRLTFDVTFNCPFTESMLLTANAKHGSVCRVKTYDGLKYSI